MSVRGDDRRRWLVASADADAVRRERTALLSQVSELDKRLSAALEQQDNLQQLLRGKDARVSAIKDEAEELCVELRNSLDMAVAAQARREQELVEERELLTSGLRTMVASLADENAALGLEVKRLGGNLPHHAPPPKPELSPVIFQNQSFVPETVFPVQKSPQVMVTPGANNNQHPQHSTAHKMQNAELKLQQTQQTQPHSSQQTRKNIHLPQVLQQSQKYYQQQPEQQQQLENSTYHSHQQPTQQQQPPSQQPASQQRPPNTEKKQEPQSEQLATTLKSDV